MRRCMYLHILVPVPAWSMAATPYQAVADRRRLPRRPVALMAAEGVLAAAAAEEEGEAVQVLAELGGTVAGVADEGE